MDDGEAFTRIFRAVYVWCAMAAAEEVGGILPPGLRPGRREQIYADRVYFWRRLQLLRAEQQKPSG